MNTKFVRDEYGLRLELEPANDNERVLVAEILNTSPYGFKQKNLTVALANDRLTVCRPVYIGKHLLRLRGFREVLAEENATNDLVFWKQREDALWLVIGSGTFRIYKVELVADYPETVANFARIEDSGWSFKYDGAEHMLAADSYLYSKLQTAEQLDEILKNIPE